MFCKAEQNNLRIIHGITQSVGATGGVYKGQGRNQHELMTRALPRNTSLKINSCNTLPMHIADYPTFSGKVKISLNASV